MDIPNLFAKIQNFYRKNKLYLKNLTFQQIKTTLNPFSNIAANILHI